MSEPLRIALLGAGMLGGSFALAVKASSLATHITAYDINGAHSKLLQARGAVDHVADSPQAAVSGADIVVFAVPVRSYRALTTAIAAHIKPGVILTDMGSVKGGMVQLSTLLPGIAIVPAHPIAGSEKSGPEAADADLFHNKICILTPQADADSTAVRTVHDLWQATGAQMLQMPWQVHDQIYAYVSHLPHLIAFVAASYFHCLGVSVLPEDAVLHQFLRISRSNPRMWTDIVLENREALLPALATYIALLEHFVTELRTGEKTDSADTLAIAKTLLPRVLAASLISSVSLYEKQADINLRPFGAGGMRDMVAPAAHTPEADTEAISQHASTMADLIERIIPEFRALETQIGADDADTVFHHIRRMVADAHMLVTPRN